MNIFQLIFLRIGRTIFFRSTGEFKLSLKRPSRSSSVYFTYTDRSNLLFILFYIGELFINMLFNSRALKDPIEHLRIFYLKHSEVYFELMKYEQSFDN